MLNADTCLTPANGNTTCGNPVVGGAPLPTEFLATQIGAPQGGAASDAVYPNNAGSAVYFATLSSLASVTNVTSTTSMTVNLNYGGTFSFITGITPDPQNPNVLYVGADPCQGCINGSGQIWKITPIIVELPPPVAPVITSALAGPGTGQATLAWAPVVNGVPILNYVIEVLLASPTGGAPTPSGLPNLTIASPTTTATINGLTPGTAYVFEVQECNSLGCSAFSSPSSPVTAFLVQPGSVTNVVAVDAGTGTSAAVAWTVASNGNSPITSSTITPFLGGVTALPATTILGSGTSATVSGLTCGNSYTFTVAVTNAAGTSAASAPSVPTTITCPIGADVSVLESALAAANPGTQVTYTITIHNGGPASAASVTFNETLPAPLVSDTTTQGVCAGTVGQTPFSCNVGSLASGATATVTVTVQLPNAVTGTFTNAMTVNATNSSGANIDPNLANNTASATVTTIGCEAGVTTTDVQVTGSSNNGNPVHGTPVTFTWQIKDNQGSVAANCSTFTANVNAPSGDTLTINSAATTQGSCAIANNQLSCSLANIAGGSTATVTITATPSAAAPANSYAMTGVANFTGADTNTANNSSVVLIGAQ